jgi:hypothetical protein
MRKLMEETDTAAFWTLEAAGIQSGRIVEIRPGGKPMVDFDGNESGLLEARCLHRASFSNDYAAGSAVLLAFDRGDRTHPIILGALSESCEESPGRPFRAEGTQVNAVVDGTRIVLRADREIVLECGESSLILQKDGRVVLKGVEVVSRASRTNKIRGACVKIN